MILFKKKTVIRIKFFTLKHKIIFSSVSTLALLLIMVHPRLRLLQDNPSPVSPQWQTEYANRTRASAEPSAYQCCTPSNNPFRTNLYFVKNHKTGSSTVQSVILRFAMLNSLDVLNLNYATYYWPLSDQSIHRETVTPNNKYHILAQHTRYDPKLKSYQYPNTSMVTSLRHPATLFQSMYNFFNMDQQMGMSFETFIKAPSKPALAKGQGGFMAYRGYNQMSVDLGFDLNQRDNQTAIDEFIEKIDRDFDLVMITEQMDASFVLLANLMGWPLENVAHVNLNVRPPESDPYKLTTQDVDTLMELNQVDTQLYYHFLKKFKECKRKYGEDKLHEQINQLKFINQQLKDKCVKEEVVRGLNYGRMRSIEYIPKNESDLNCVYSTQINPTLSKTARLVQAERLQSFRKKK